LAGHIFRRRTKAVEGATPFKPKKGEQPGQTMEQFIMRAAEGERRSPRGQKGTRKEKAAQTEGGRLQAKDS
jgi:hypothetical protein